MSLAIAHSYAGDIAEKEEVLVSVPGTMNYKISSADNRYRNFKEGLERIATKVKELLIEAGVKADIIKTNADVQLTSTGDGGHSSSTISVK